MIKAVLCLQFPLSEGFQHSEISPCSESQQFLSDFSRNWNEVMIKDLGQSNNWISVKYIFFSFKTIIVSNSFQSYFGTNLKYYSTLYLVCFFFFLVEIVTTSYSCIQSFYFDYSILWWGRRWQSGRFLSWLQLCLGKAETHGSLQESSSWDMCLIWIYSLWNFIKRPEGITFF